jgi:hypothetical protein
MKRYLLLCVALATSACATKMSTKSFSEQEAVIAKECLAPANANPSRSLEVNPVTKRSPMTEAAMCYSQKARVLAWANDYHNAQIVEDFGQYLVKLSSARDHGLIDTPTALTAYRDSVSEFRAAIQIADAREERRRVREFGDRLEVFAYQMNAIAVQQTALRGATSPTFCTFTGVYQTSGIACNK